MKAILKLQAIQHLRNSLALGLFLFGSVMFLSAQDAYPRAQWMEGEYLAIQKDAPQSYGYEVSLQEVKTASVARAEEHFRTYNTQLVTFSINKERQVLIVEIERRMKPDWTISDWNTYLRELMTKS